MGSVAAIDDVEGAVGFSGGGFGSAPLGGGPGGAAHIVHVDGVDAEVFAPEPFHLVALGFVDSRQTEPSGQKSDIIRPVDVRKAQYGVPQPVRLDHFLQLFFGFEFVLCYLGPRFHWGVFFAAAGGAGGGGRGLVDHARAALAQGGGLAAGALAGEVEGERDGAGAVDGVVLGVAGFAAAVKDVVEGATGGEGEDLGEGFCG